LILYNCHCSHRFLYLTLFPQEILYGKIAAKAGCRWFLLISKIEETLKVLISKAFKIINLASYAGG